MSSFFKSPPVPTPQPVTPMPDPDSVKKAQRKAIIEQQARAGGGRDSTILSSREGL